MKKIQIAAFLVLLIAAASGCKHEEFKVMAGKGGNATVVVYPQHHLVGLGLDSMVVYVKYNTLDAPAGNVYDDSAVCTYLNFIPSCSFAGLKNGKYYFYARGYDNNEAKRVKGGIPYTITSQQSQNLMLAVSED